MLPRDNLTDWRCTQQLPCKTVENHIQNVKEVLERITYDAGLRICFKKCKFFKTEARVLGMMVSRTGVMMDPKKIETIVNWPLPIDGKAMQRFMGAANFNRVLSRICQSSSSIG